MSTIKLYPSQIDHYNHLVRNLTKGRSYIDTSPTGSGKTVIALKLAQYFNLDLALVAPTTLLNNWNIEAAKYNVRVSISITYDKLRGMRGVCSHPYLTFDDIYSATDVFKYHVERGILLVFDEFAMAKNTSSSRSKACHALSRAITETNNRSKIGLISALPGEKEEHVVPLCQISGIIHSPVLYHYNRSTGIYIDDGLEQLKSFANMIDPLKYQCMLPSIPPTNNRSAVKTAFMLYKNFVKPNISSSMPKLVVFDGSTVIEPDAKNGYYNFDVGDLRKLQTGKDMLMKAFSMSNERTIDSHTAPDLGNSQTALAIMENAKLSVIERLVRNILSRPHDKVVVYLNYLDNIDDLVTMLVVYLPEILVGATKVPVRDQIISKFNQPNDECRLLICGITVGGIGINLHDTHGGFPRTSLIVPSYYFSRCHQAAGRIYRQGCKSIPIVRFIYAKNADSETIMLDSIARKTNIVKKIVSEEDASTFPGDYMSIIEE